MSELSTNQETRKPDPFSLIHNIILKITNLFELIPIMRCIDVHRLDDGFLLRSAKVQTLYEYKGEPLDLEFLGLCRTQASLR